MRRVLVLAALAVLSFASIGAEASGPVCPKLLPPLPGHSDSLARTISIGGSAAGTSWGGGTTRGVVWGPLGVPRRLAPLSGDHASEALAMNGDGQVAGTSRGSVTTAVRWDGRSGPRRLRPLPGDLESFALGIDNAGRVVGFSRGRGQIGGRDGGFRHRPVLWGTDGKPRALQLPSGYREGNAEAISQSGVIVGFVFGPTGTDDRAVVWDAAGRPSLRPLLGSSLTSESYAVNLAGVAVGDSGLGDTAGTSWTASVGELVPPAGIDAVETYGVNARGETVGFGRRDGRSVALRWTASGKGYVLRPLDGDAEAQAWAINRGGEIAGVSLREGRARAVIWSSAACGG